MKIAGTGMRNAREGVSTGLKAVASGKGGKTMANLAKKMKFSKISKFLKVSLFCSNPYLS